jgi:hypothetical protein
VDIVLILVLVSGRTFSIPDNIDIALKKRAVDDGVRFSSVVVS